MKHYEGIYDKGEIKWVGEKPPDSMINLMLETLERYRDLLEAPPSDLIASQSQDSDDIASPVVDEED